MLPELKEIKARRKELDLTQKELSEKCGVPQSVIAKIENEQISPSYESAKKIFEALNAEKIKYKTAKNIMTKKIISIREKERVSKAIELMNKYGISQLPVLRKNIPIGTVTEKNIVDKIGSEKISNSTIVSDLMEECLPIIETESKIEAVSSMLKYYPAILVKEKDKLTGIITRTNIIRKSIK
ncbi:MAG: hypothetical protein COT90_03305 [Candidatus Diapherotrites archaeon CG10_big_fil_rev_8_21_14_0_10_31_34]|nr:MAG: hypothetical protein COT90_03305 [Candidatus Diapherotrites archaeon CG10_big_fil_rev_8_21_14_0_10_31_34]